MKHLVLLLCLCAVPSLLLAHPGKTDRNGGHQCIKDCAEWDLYYREYHLHDKEGRTVRVAKRMPRSAERAVVPEPAPVEQRPAEPPVLEASVLPAVPIVPEEEPFPAYWMLVLLLLLVLFLLRRRSARDTDQPS